LIKSLLGEWFICYAGGRSLARLLCPLRFDDHHVKYAPAIVPIALTVPITIPAMSLPLKFDELLDPVLARAVVVEYSVRNTTGGGVVSVTNAVVIVR
jgi:hypothetical protein